MTDFIPNAKKDEFQIKESEFLLAIAQDNRQVQDIPFVARDSAFKEIDCEGKGKFCHLPFLFPTPNRLGPNMIRAKPIKDPSFDAHKAWAELIDRKLYEEETNYIFRITGSDQISVTLEPVGQVEIKGWKLATDEKFVCNSTFAFLHCVGVNCGNWELEVVMRNVDSPNVNVIDVTVSSHTLHGDKMHSKTLKDLHQEIKEKRSTGDWRWAMTASSWTVDFFRRRF